MNSTFNPQIRSGTQAPAGSVKTFFKQAVTTACDPQWLSGAVSCFGVASRTLEFVGNGADEFVPFLTIISSPFTLYHACKKAIKRIKQALLAFSLGEYIDAVYFSNRAFTAVGTTGSILVKPFAGGVHLFKVANVPAVSFSFTKVLPVVQTIFGAVGAVTDGWSLIRTIKALRSFNQHASQLNGSLVDLENFILEYHDPEWARGQNRETRFAKNIYKENFFCRTGRRKELREKFDRYLSLDYQRSFELNMQIFMPPFLGEIESAQSSFEFIELDLKICDWLMLQQPHNLEELYEIKKQLLEVKAQLLHEGNKLIGTMRAEIHRKILMTTVSLLVACLSMTSGTLFMISSEYHDIAAALSCSSSGIEIVTLLFEKAVSQDRFYAIDKFLFQRNIKHVSPLQYESLQFEHEEQSLPEAM